MRTSAPWILLAACLATPACDDPTPDESPDASVASADGAAPAPDGSVSTDAATRADASSDAEVSPDADLAPDADLSPDALPPVPPSGTWFVEAVPVAGVTASAVVTGGELVLSAEGDHDHACTSIVGRCASIDVFQRGLRGDFDVSLDVASFRGPPGSDVFLFAEVEGQLQHVDIGDNEPIRLRIHRENDRLVMSYQRPGEAEHADVDEYWPGDLRIGIGLTQSGSAQPAVAHLAGFHVSGGGGQVKADAFDEDGTLYP